MKLSLATLILLTSLPTLQADVASAPPPVTQAITSFGACISDGYVYVYGGHTGEAHDHSRDNLSPEFIRYPLNQAGAAWEKLPEDKAVQGTALVSWNGKVIRVAGMFATNAAGEKATMFSTDSVRCYDPEAKTWSDWPPLPDKVSSHDAVVVGNVLYVAGGWKLEGESDAATWHEHGWYLNLDRREEGWKNLPPMPGILRAGTMASAGGEVWWVGGMGDDEGGSNAAFAYHPEKGTWRKGPELPGRSRIKAFGSSTFSSGDVLFNSGMDGILYSLDPAGTEWAATTVTHRHGRIFHRSLPVGGGVFWTIAGASRNGHLSDIEVHPVPEQFPVKSSASAWPSFRGGANNELAGRSMPDQWGGDANVAWKVELPGYGQSAPVFGNGGIYVTSAAGEKKLEGKPAKAPGAPGADRGDSGQGGDRGESAKGAKGSKGGGSMEGLIKAADGPLKTKVALTRIDPETGRIDWTLALPSSDPEPHNQYRSCAAPSPCLDDAAVYAWFESGDLLAVNHQGVQAWHRNIGKEYGLPKGNHGLGGSLAQDGESLYLLVDHDGPSYLLCLNKKDGATRWKVDRPKRVSWSSPVVTSDAVIISSNGIVEELDKSTGKQRWAVEGIEGNTVAGPLVFDDFVLAPSSDKGQTRLIRRGGPDDRVVWQAGEKSTASFASPVFAQGQIILVSKASIATGLDWRTGDELWNHRLPDGCWATPAVLGSKIYFFSTSGATLVADLTSGGLQELHRNELPMDTSKVYGVIPAGDRWIIRTGGEVAAIAAKGKS